MVENGLEVGVLAAAIGRPHPLDRLGEHHGETIVLGQLDPAGLFGELLGGLPIVRQGEDHEIVGVAARLGRDIDLVGTVLAVEADRLPRQPRGMGGGAERPRDQRGRRDEPHTAPRVSPQG